jgi:hypothetical protein
MKPHVLALFALALGLTVPTSASVIYNNYPIVVGAADYINTNNTSVSDPFALISSAIATNVVFGAAVVTGGTVMTAIDWSIGTNFFGSDVASGAGASISGLLLYPNVDAFDWYSLTFSLPNVRLSAGTTYYLTLHNANGASAGWDINFLHGLDAEATNPFVGTNQQGSNAFQILDAAAAPEPATASYALLSCGLALFVAFLQRRNARTHEPRHQ